MARLAIVVGRRKRRMDPTRSRGAPRRLIMCWSKTGCWRFKTEKLGSEMDSGGQNTCGLIRHPQLKINSQRCPRNPRTGLFLCFLSVLMCSETIVVSVCLKRVSKVYREAFVIIETSLGRPKGLLFPGRDPLGDQDEFRKAVKNLFEGPGDPRVCAGLFSGAVYLFVGRASRELL
ncbi:hypothetical protein CRG98_038710 [Punica granatum]|uniref:Uncharacterized protein n=1 Tax=Punica granatum TaxID=22663 RepID=A0A2I0IAA0_PUNGR|nr:hypothetical protein CRG98_038710 [Punica granatum]